MLDLESQPWLATPSLFSPFEHLPMLTQSSEQRHYPVLLGHVRSSHFIYIFFH